MTMPKRELDALNAYLKLMANKGADGANLKYRKDFLQRLVPRIAAQPLDGNLYRAAVEESLQEVDKAAWPFFLNVAREYYHFWIDDIRAIAAMNANGGYEVAPVSTPIPTEKLETLWKNLDAEKFSIAELWPLKAYTAALREEGAEQAVVDTRSKLVKLLLVRLREVTEKDGRHYQIVVDSTLPLFVLKETRHLFVVVVREFFYFWIGNPDAARHIVLGASES